TTTPICPVSQDRTRKGYELLCQVARGHPDQETCSDLDPRLGKASRRSTACMARERRPDRRGRLAASADPTRNLAAAWFFHWHLNQEQARGGGFGAREDALQFYLGACINSASGAVE